MTTFTQTRVQTADRRRAVTVAMWTAQILLGSFLLFASALPKFAGQAAAIETFVEIGWGDWFRYVTGAAATALIGLMAGAALTQILVLEPAWSLLPIGYGVIFALIAWTRRAEIRALLTRPAPVSRAARDRAASS
jgi:hypothetical protein